jgi:hypothetical protein
LLDGRNRLRACAKMKTEPKFTAYPSWHDREHEWIISQNICRRSLTEDQKAVITARVYDWNKQPRLAELKKIRIGSAQGDHGKEGGRGHKKPLQTNSSAGVSRARAGIAGEIAEQADISHHKARQAVQVAEHAPELLDGIMTGKVKLKDAARKARAKSPPKPRRRPAWNMETQCRRVIGLVSRLASQCPAGERRQFCRWIARQCEGIVLLWLRACAALSGMRSNRGTMREIQVTGLDHDNLDPENFCSSGLQLHPVAGMFPLLEGNEFEELCDDIQASGLANPIVIHGDILLDGRNRLRACAKVQIDPKFIAYSGYRDREHEWIVTQNIHRRSLPPDQRAAILQQVYEWHKRRRLAELKQSDVLRQQGIHGKEGGRGHKKPLETNSSPRVYKRLRTELAEQAGISEHKAQQAIQVAEHAPELLDGVRTGKVKLKDAAQKARAQSPSRPRRPSVWNMETQCRRVIGLVIRLASQCPPSERRQFCRAIARECERIV